MYITTVYITVQPDGMRLRTRCHGSLPAYCDSHAGNGTCFVLTGPRERKSPRLEA
jgi:hypothetical protein